MGRSWADERTPCPLLSSTSRAGGLGQEVANEGYWLDQMAADLDNLRVAFAWSRQEADRVEIALRLATAAGSFWR